MQHETPGRCPRRWAGRGRDALPVRKPHRSPSHRHDSPGWNHRCYTDSSAPNWSSFHTSRYTVPIRFQTYRRSPTRLAPSSRLLVSCSPSSTCTRRRPRRNCFQHNRNPRSCYHPSPRIPIRPPSAVCILPPSTDQSLYFSLCPIDFLYCHTLLKDLLYHSTNCSMR